MSTKMLKNKKTGAPTLQQYRDSCTIVYYKYKAAEF